jgi:hypothetical protein
MEPRFVHHYKHGNSGLFERQTDGEPSSARHAWAEGWDETAMSIQIARLHEPEGVFG